MKCPQLGGPQPWVPTRDLHCLPHPSSTDFKPTAQASWPKVCPIWLEQFPPLVPSLSAMCYVMAIKYGVMKQLSVQWHRLASTKLEQQRIHRKVCAWMDGR